MEAKLFTKQMKLFLLVAFALPYALGVLMAVGYGRGVNLGVFANVQMLYPAAGVMLAALVTRRGDARLPRRFFISFLAVAAVGVLLAVGSVLAPSEWWLVAVNYLLIVGSILCGVLLLTQRKESRGAYGLRGGRPKASILAVLLFIGLYVGRTVFAYAIGGQLGAMGEIAANPLTWISLVTLPLNFFLVFIAFFGEEYGWRAYLQPILQQRFGLRRGVLLLGVVWGLWHLPLNLFYYATPQNGFLSLLYQFVTCITLGVFFAYAYMKTDNVWVPVILHFLNNNLVPVITGTFSASVIENQQYSWEALPLSLVMNGVLFLGFLLTKYFKDKAFALPTLDQRADAFPAPEEDGTGAPQPDNN